MNLKIRNSTDGDVPVILELLYELERPRPVDKNDTLVFQNKIKEYISDSDKEIFLAELDSQIVGLVSIMILTRLNHVKPEMYIPELVVTKGFRNKGIGKELISFCVKIASEKNCYRIRLESGNMRKDSHEFYRNLGFEQYAQTFAINVS